MLERYGVFFLDSVWLEEEIFGVDLCLSTGDESSLIITLGEETKEEVEEEGDNGGVVKAGLHALFSFISSVTSGTGVFCIFCTFFFWLFFLFFFSNDASEKEGGDEELVRKEGGEREEEGGWEEGELEEWGTEDGEIEEEGEDLEGEWKQWMIKRRRREEESQPINVAAKIPKYEREALG